ncbi:MAG: efflux RND transporter permease subunit [Vampirovibrionales bacterium]
MFSAFFIKRPIFAGVIATAITLLGLIALPMLPVQQYPDISPPTLEVVTSYPGADALTVEQSVTTPIEQSINGVERMRYISSTSTADGGSKVDVTFALGTDLNDAIVNVQNRINQVQNRLPQEVRTLGVKVKKAENNILLGIGFMSKDGSLSETFISNYVDRYVLDKIKRVKGVGSINIRGGQTYAMRLWLDPIKLASRKISVQEVVTALQQQNVDVPAGALGGQPAPSDQRFMFSVVVQGRLQSAEAFENMIVAKRGEAIIRLSDIGRAELGAEDYSISARRSRYKAVGLPITVLPEANALSVAKEVKAKLAELKTSFPKGLDYEIGFDATPFIEESINEVLHTLVEAIVIVVLTIWTFLQNWRTTIIPAITIPVSLIGSFILIQLFGFSINTLTLFGITLATGLVVDDAIVVVENIVRYMEEKGLSPLEAALKGMEEVFSAVVATSIVLVAVFVPVAFFPGATGKLYEQFALTIAFTIGISLINALTLSPALCAVFLKPKVTQRSRQAIMDASVAHEAIESQHEHPPHGFVLFRLFDAFLKWCNQLLLVILKQLMRLKPLVVMVFTGLLALTLLLFTWVPKGYVPTEDQGYFIIVMQAPEGSNFKVTKEVIQKVENIVMADPDVHGTFALNGFSFFGSGANKAIMFVPLKPIHERKHDASHSMNSVINRLRPKLLGLGEAVVIPFEPPPIRGFSAGGFEFQLQDKVGTLALDDLVKTQWGIIGMASQQGKMTGGFAAFNTSTPQLKVDIDREKAMQLGVPLPEIIRTLQIYLGGLYVNDFTFQGKVYRVVLQGDDPFRSSPEALDSMYVKSDAGTLVPMNALIHSKLVSGPQQINHYNLLRSSTIRGSVPPDVPSADSFKAVEEATATVGNTSYGYEWTGIALEQKEGSQTSTLLFLLGMVFVYLVLAAQYESLLDPAIIVLSVPLAVMGGLATLKLLGMENDVFAQIGLVMLIGLASKNAILIVEFANQLREQHPEWSLEKVAIEATRVRFRPILMTSFAFILGVLPMVFATGAGSAARHSLGVTVAGGMLVATLLGLLAVPVLYVLLKRTRKSKPSTPHV